jgi:hypothetical protein
MCDTRFIERHDALIVFGEQCSRIVSALEKISEECSDNITQDQARSLLKAIVDPTFLVALCCAKKLMSLTVALSRSLQSINQDLVQAIHAVSHVQVTLANWRSGEVEEWEYERDAPFTNAEKLSKKLNIELCMSRCVSHQTKRNNVPDQTVSEYSDAASGIHTSTTCPKASVTNSLNTT